MLFAAVCAKNRRVDYRAGERPGVAGATPGRITAAGNADGVRNFEVLRRLGNRGCKIKGFAKSGVVLAFSLGNIAAF